VLTFNEAQVIAWLSPVLWPFLRILALFTTAPVISQRMVPRRVRVALAFLIVVCAQVSLPPMPQIPLDSATAFMAVISEVLIGLSLGFAARIVFSAVEFAGELIGLQMGLNYAGFFDPATGGQATAVSRFYGTIVSWIFIIINGHLLMIGAVVQSFNAFPVSAEPFGFVRTLKPQVWGSEIFSLGLWIALPLIAMLLFVNLVMGVISRVASQMNVFSVGFPVTLGVGLIGMLLTLPMLQAPFTMALEKMLALFT
jgi:flagellar biosynthesis protein FliR